MLPCLQTDKIEAVVQNILSVTAGWYAIIMLIEVLHLLSPSDTLPIQ